MGRLLTILAVTLCVVAERAPVRGWSQEGAPPRAAGASVEAIYLTGFGGGPARGQFKRPRGIAVDDGKIFVADSGYCRVQVFDPDGEFLYMWGTFGEGPGQFRNPSAIALDHAGHVYVTDAGNDRIQVFTREGVFVRAWGSSGRGPGQFRRPDGIAVDHDGNVFVADSYNLRVQVYTSDGRFLRSWGSKGNGDGQFLQPSWPGDGAGPVGIAVDSEGDVYVTDPWNARVQVFTKSGAFLRKWGHLARPGGQFNTPAAIAAGRRGGSLNTPTGIAIDPIGHVLVASSGATVTLGAFSVQKFTTSGEFLRRWDGDGYGPGQFDEPAGVAVDGKGNFYVADTGNNRVQKFNREGAFVRQWGSIGDGLLRGPTDVALDREGNVYVTEGQNKRVQKFSPAGTFLAKWGTPSRSVLAEGSFIHPGSVAVDHDGHVYVADKVGQRIQVFTGDGEFVRMWGGRGDGRSALDVPGAIAVDREGHVYVAEHHRLQKFSSDGRFLDSWAVPRNTFTKDVAVDGGGNVYVTEVHEDRKWSRVRVLSPGGKELAKWASVGLGGKFEEATRITVDSAGRVYIVEWWNCQIEVFSSSGTFLGRWGSCGFGDGQFGNATGVAVDATGKVYVADYTYNRVQVFQVREVRDRRERDSSSPALRATAGHPSHES